MSKDITKLRVAIVTDHAFEYKGVTRVTESIGKLFDDSDYYFLFGDRGLLEKKLSTKNIYFSALQKLPFLKKYYKYTYFLWPMYIESFDLSKYDLVISSSFSVAHGAITNVNSKHIAYIHTPMRYAWDLSKQYFSKGNFSLLKRLVIPFFLNYLRVWDVGASARPDCMISNSKFVSKRMKKYWGRESDTVIYPPVNLYQGSVKSKRDDYFVTGTSFEPNKCTEFLLKCAKELHFNLKVIGKGGNYKTLRRRFKNVECIEFLGTVTDSEKYEVLTNARGYIAVGIEDFGIFPVEAMSCGTPVLAYRGGGYLESVTENVSGIFFEEYTVENFGKALNMFREMDWNPTVISKSVESFSRERFEREFRASVLKNIE